MAYGSSGLMQPQEEVDLLDAERLRNTQSNVKMLQRHFQADTLPWILRMTERAKSSKVMRIVEALEGRSGLLSSLNEGISRIGRKLKGSAAELSMRVQNLLVMTCVQANGFVAGGSVYRPRSTKLHERSFRQAKGYCKAGDQGHGDRYDGPPLF